MHVALADPSLFTIPYDVALTGALAARGCAVTLLGRALRPGETVPDGVRVVPHFYRRSERLGGVRVGGVARALKGVEHAADLVRLAREIDRRGVDLVHFQWTPLPAVDRALLPLIRRRAPTVLTVHDTTPFNGSARTRLETIGARGVLAGFDHLIVHTERGREELLRRGIAPDRVTVIPHGPLRSAPVTADAAESAEATILLFGKLKPYKGADLLIDAFARLPDALRRKARLRIVGEPLMDPAGLRAQALSLGIGNRVTWDLRYIGDAEIGKVLAAADVLAFPYREIEVSGVLMMAFAHGKPIVASRIGAFAEILRDGVHGRLVPPEDPAALSAALADVLSDKARAARMGAAVRALGDDLPGWDEIAERTMDVYARLVRRPALSAAPTTTPRTSSPEARPS